MYTMCTIYVYMFVYVVQNDWAIEWTQPDIQPIYSFSRS